MLIIMLSLVLLVLVERANSAVGAGAIVKVHVRLLRCLGLVQKEQVVRVERASEIHDTGVATVAEVFQRWLIQGLLFGEEHSILIGDAVPTHLPAMLAKSCLLRSDALARLRVEVSRSGKADLLSLLGGLLPSGGGILRKDGNGLLLRDGEGSLHCVLRIRVTAPVLGVQFTASYGGA